MPVIESRPTKFIDAKLLLRPGSPDNRGAFRRMFSEVEYAEFGIVDRFVEDNVSFSKRGVLRGLHFDYRLAKFVQVLVGEIFDAIVDVRLGSPTFGAWEAFRLTAEGCEQLYVPRGFAHGFYVVSSSAVVAYKQTAPYDPAHDGAVAWDDPAIGVAWPLDGDPTLSERDGSAPGLDALRARGGDS